VGRVLRTLEPELVARAPEDVVAPALGVEHPEMLRRLGASSYVCVPLLARQRAIGAITLVRSEPPDYHSSDLGLVEELARRAALAIDNARLYAAAKAAGRAHEELIASVSTDIRPTITAILLAAGRAVESGGESSPEMGVIRSEAARALERIDALLGAAPAAAPHGTTDPIRAREDAVET
jgi:GAF domain-containing protein